MRENKEECGRMREGGRERGWERKRDTVVGRKEDRVGQKKDGVTNRGEEWR